MSASMLAESISSNLMAGSWISTLLAILALGVRLWLVYRRGSKLRLDDDVLLLSTVLLLFLTICYTVAICNGLGRDPSTIGPNQLSLIHALGAVENALGIVSLTTGKTSFGVTLARIFSARRRAGSRRRWPKPVVWTTIVAINIINFLFLILRFVTCGTGVPMFSGPVCIGFSQYKALAMLGSISSACVTIFFILLPFLFLRKLPLSKTEKSGVAVAVFFGLLAASLAIVRAVILPTLGPQEARHDNKRYIMFKIAEAAATIVAVSIPFYDSQYHLERHWLMLSHVHTRLEDDEEAEGEERREDVDVDVEGHQPSRTRTRTRDQYQTQPQTQETRQIGTSTTTTTTSSCCSPVQFHHVGVHNSITIEAQYNCRTRSSSNSEGKQDQQDQQDQQQNKNKKKGLVRLPLPLPLPLPVVGKSSRHARNINNHNKRRRCADPNHHHHQGAGEDFSFGGGGIVKTEEVTVDYRRRRDSEVFGAPDFDSGVVFPCDINDNCASTNAGAGLGGGAAVVVPPPLPPPSFSGAAGRPKAPERKWSSDTK